MPTCRGCGSQAVKWENVASRGEPEKWALWTTEEGSFLWKHDCGFKGESNCNGCDKLIRWKECFDTVKGNHFKPYDHTKNQEHHCKWKHIKHLPPKNRPPY